MFLLRLTAAEQPAGAEASDGCPSATADCIDSQPSSWPSSGPAARACSRQPARDRLEDSCEMSLRISKTPQPARDRLEGWR